MTVLHVMPNVSRAFGGPTPVLIGYAWATQTAVNASRGVPPCCNGAVKLIS